MGGGGVEGGGWEWRGGSLGSEHARRPLPLQPSSLTSCGIEEEYGFNREGEQGGEVGRGVVLASHSFNGENAWMLKRKWVECWDISGEFWVHYWNFNGAGALGECEFWGNRSGIVWGLHKSN